MFSVAQAQSVGKRTDAGLPNVKPLQIGDTIPDELWHMPLQVVNHPDGKKIITLNDYRDKKLIILDFWATWCAPCVKELPGLLRLEDSLTCKVIALSDEPVNKIKQFLSGRSDFPDSELYSFQRNSSIDIAFPRSSIPHTAVIYKGVVRSVTLPNLLDKVNLSELLRNANSRPIPTKVELEDLRETLLVTALRDTSAGQFQYTVFVPEIDGIVPKMRWVSDTLNPSKRIVIANYSLHSIMAIATQRGDVFLRNPNRIIVKDGPTARNIKEEELMFLKESKMGYEGVYPVNTSFQTAAYRLADDLKLYKGINITIDILPVAEDVYSFTGYKEQKTDTKWAYPIKQVLSYLNQGVRGVIASVGEQYEKEKVHLGADLASLNHADVEEILLSRGWTKKRHKKEMDLLVLQTGGSLSKGGI
ncbi:TlpA family protein disulfide reductase [Sphingobacterium hotanense]|uniref:TlpA family protein disulfide reductase n=1 Tax=Sphingobacterium hotanense TaxID=649196 RepID=UPI0021A94126|nr:TlpA disulfide reductase family protein [Sphingobacterium hotanense]MCT1525043.1 TlpA family protein disulfide reductase [Sphingobacterium hotanense]